MHSSREGEAERERESEREREWERQSGRDGLRTYTYANTCIYLVYIVIASDAAIYSDKATHQKAIKR